MRKKISILGHFGDGFQLFDGQTIKTRILYEELSKRTDWDIDCIDTFMKKKHPIKLGLALISTLFLKRDMIVLLSGNGMKMLFPMLSFFSKNWRVNIYHDVIGGNLDKYVIKYPKFKKYLNSFSANWVETEKLKKKLEEIGITNCEVIPNFKRLDIQEKCNYKGEITSDFRFCIFSRIMKEKGVEEAIRVIEKINRERDTRICTLDLYGQVDSKYVDEFKRIMSETTDAIRYKGVVPFDESVAYLKNYYALLFPTYWDGEGFPGTIIDAYAAGIPVIASDWGSNAEIVKNGSDGIIYPSNIARDLEEAILYAMNNQKKMCKMRKNSGLKAKIYQPDAYIERIIGEIELT